MMMKKLQYKTRAFDYVCVRRARSCSFPLAQLQCARRRICAVVLNKSIKRNILFIICFIAHADNLMCTVCLSIDTDSRRVALISFILYLRVCLSLSLPLSLSLFHLTQLQCTTHTFTQTQQSLASLNRWARCGIHHHVNWCNANILWNWLYFPQHILILFVQPISFRLSSHSHSNIPLRSDGTTVRYTHMFELKIIFCTIQQQFLYYAVEAMEFIKIHGRLSEMKAIERGERITNNCC